MSDAPPPTKKPFPTALVTFAVIGLAVLAMWMTARSDETSDRGSVSAYQPAQISTTRPAAAPTALATRPTTAEDRMNLTFRADTCRSFAQMVVATGTDAQRVSAFRTLARSADPELAAAITRVADVLAATGDASLAEVNRVCEFTAIP